MNYTIVNTVDRKPLKQNNNEYLDRKLSKDYTHSFGLKEFFNNKNDPAKIHANI
jgi:hypothetical protein